MSGLKVERAVERAASKFIHDISHHMRKVTTHTQEERRERGGWRGRGAAER